MTQETMSDWRFGLTLVMLGGILLFVLSSIQSNIDTRENNQLNLQNAKSCLELQTHYETALQFEKGFKDHNLPDEQIKIFQDKVKELNCP